MVEEMVELACQIQPYEVTLVPERREEVTTEGGLDVLGNRDRLSSVIKRLHDAGVVVALFVDPDEATITESRTIGADAVELIGLYVVIILPLPLQSPLPSLYPTTQSS